MPELPEVETTRRSLLPGLVGRRIETVTLRRDTLRLPIPPDFRQRVTGSRVIDIRRRAKYLLFDLDRGDTMLAHLGMSGSFLLTDASHRPRTHDHVLLFLDNGQVLAFHDPRRFGLILIDKTDKIEAHSLLAHLGPEPLGAGFTPAYLAAVLAVRQGPIKPVLMDQRLVVGVGNIYASESLFLARIHPATPAARVAASSHALVAAIHQSLNAALASGGSSLRDFTSGDGKTGYFQHQFNTYEREGEPCVACAAPIARIMQAGRASYFCPQCQKQKSARKKSKQKTAKK